MEKNIEEFKTLRNNFESITKKRYRKIFNKSCDNLKIYEIIDELANSKIKSVYSKNKDFIDYCRLKRNLLSHGNYEKEFSVYTDEFINAFKELIEKARPRTAYSMSIEVVTRDIDCKISKVLREMSENNYTHMPITKDGKLVGMLSEASLVKYMAENEEVLLDQKGTFSENMDLIDRKYSEGNVFFFGRNEDYDKVVNKFIDDYENHQKVSCILITEKGNREEKVMGILTAWDIIGKD